MSEIRVLNLCHKRSIVVDIYRQSLLRVAPKIIGHEVKAACVKMIKHLTILKKHKRLFCRSRKHGIRLHILGVYAYLSVVI